MEMTTDERHVQVLEHLAKKIVEENDDEVIKDYNNAYKNYQDTCRAADEHDRDVEKAKLERERFEHDKSKAKKDFWLSVASISSGAALVVATLATDLKGVITNKNSFNWAKNLFDKGSKIKIK